MFLVMLMMIFCRRYFVFLSIVLSAPVFAQLSFGPSQQLSDFALNSAHLITHDWDNDGDLDVIASDGNRNGFSNQVVRAQIWENDGAGNFAMGREWSSPDHLQNRIIAIKDANGDGRPDLWIKNNRFGDPLSHFIAYGNEMNDFDEPVFVEGDSGIRDEFGKELDINGDGDADFIHMSNNWLFVTLANSAVTQTLLTLEDDTRIESFGFSTPQSEEDQPLLFVFTRQQISVYELDQDSISLELLRSEAIIDPPLEIRFEHVISDITTPSGVIRSTSYFALEDTVLGPTPFFKTDIIQVRWTGSEIALETILETSDTSGGQEFARMMQADLDGDTLPDLLIPTVSQLGLGHLVSRLLWLRATGDGTYEEETRPVSQASYAHNINLVVDIDGDGREEFITSGFPPNALAPTSGFPQVVNFWRRTGPSGRFEPHEIRLGDFKLKFVAARDLSGRAPFVPEVDLGFFDSAFDHTASFGKELPPGKMDFLFYTSELSSGFILQRYLWLIQDEDGSFSWANASPDDFRFSLPSGEEHKLPPVDSQLIDWDRDGIEDIVSVSSGGRISYRKGSSDHTFDSHSIGIVSAAGGTTDALGNLFQLFPRIVDVDHDGDNDIVTQGTLFGPNLRYWLENDGSDEFAAVHKLPGIVYPLYTDIDGDGVEDFDGILNGEPAWAFFRPGGTVELVPKNTREGIISVDLDGDGDLDSILRKEESPSDTYSLSWQEQRDHLNFFPKETVPEPPLSSFRQAFTDLKIADGNFKSQRRQFYMIDIDADGTKDLLTGGAERLEWFRITRTTTSEIATFKAWREEMGMNGLSSSPQSDWDNDQLSNLEEFAYGTDPRMKDSSSNLLPQIVHDSVSPVYTFQIRRDAGIRYLDSVSSDLKIWNTMDTSPSIVPAAEGYDRVSYPVRPEIPRQFFRTTISTFAE